MPLEFDRTFAADYEVEEHEFSGDGSVERNSLLQIGSRWTKPSFFPGGIEGELDRVPRIALRITPAGKPSWVGVFAKGFESSHVITGLYSYPAPNKLCVVSGGYGFVVLTDQPGLYERVIAEPVRAVHPVPSRNLLLFVDYTNIAAYGPEAVAWRTARLSWDGVRITEIGENTIRGLGWDAPSDRDVEFSVDLRTGEHTGGAEPSQKTKVKSQKSKNC